VIAEVAEKPVQCRLTDWWGRSYSIIVITLEFNRLKNSCFLLEGTEFCRTHFVANRLIHKYPVPNAYVLLLLVSFISNSKLKRLNVLAVGQLACWGCRCTHCTPLATPMGWLVGWLIDWLIHSFIHSLMIDTFIVKIKCVSHVRNNYDDRSFHRMIEWRREYYSPSCLLA